MKCIFCGNESEKKWHMDCLDTAIEEEFQIDVYSLMLIKSAAIQRGGVPYWIEKLVKEGVEEGRRHKMRFKIFLFLMALDVPLEIIKENFFEFNKNCRPPAPESEVRYHYDYLRGRSRE